MIKKFGKFNTVSNYLSLSRLLVIMPIIYFIGRFEDGYEFRIYTILFMLLGYVTDVLDGYFARKLDQVTEWGKIIDPFADKIAIILVVIRLYESSYLGDFYFWLIVSRDIIIFTGGIIVSNIIGKVLPSNLLGKGTVLSIGLYLIGIVLDVQQIPWLHDVLFYLSVVLSFGSVIGYAIRGVESVRWYTKNETI
ncbi:MAG: CDP-alcohol phosphatidyltransferase [Melioribacteraceae bacterium]|nr:MAG: CDP-alcohol phosphatidyltransferase [Melioribacteraceae bacterium]